MFNLYNDGVYEVSVEVRADTAGNIATASKTVTLDTHIGDGSGTGNTSELITIDSITDDTGASNTDFITSDTTLTVRGTYNNSTGNTLSVSIAGNTYAPTLNANNWELRLPELTDGDKTFNLTITDSTGNTQSISQVISIDTIADVTDPTTGTTTPATITLDSISDDNYINSNEAGNILTLTGTSNVIGGQVLITLNNNDFTSATIAANGTYSVDVSTTQIAQFPDGQYIVKATVIADSAGNSVSHMQTVILDTTLDSDSDNPITDGNGASANVTIDSIKTDAGDDFDFSTTDTTIQINGKYNAEAGNTLSVKVDSTIYTTSSSELTLNASSNTWTLNLEALPFTTGVYSVEATIQDTAGNSEIASQSIQIIDPVNNTIINLDEISENYINEQEAQETLTIAGTSSEVGQTVSFNLNGNPLIINGTTITAIVIANGTFSIDIAANTFTNYADGEYIVEASVVASDSNTYSDSENVILDRTNNGTDGGGTAANGDDASITLNAVGDNIINAQENTSGVRVIGTTTAVEGTAISFTTSTGELITTTSNGQAITAKADGTYDVFIKIPNLVDGATINLTAQVIADKAGNIAESPTSQTLSIDLTAGTLSGQTSTTPVYEAALDTGSAPSSQERSTAGNIFTGDTDVSNSTLSSFSANGVQATPWSENSSILTLQTSSGTLFIATTATSQNGTNYNAGDYVYILENASSSTNDKFSYTLSDTAGNSASSTLNISIVDDSASANPDGAIHKYISGDTSGYSTNLILTLDVSGSMLWDADGTESTFFTRYTDEFDPNTVRIDLAKDALKNLIDKYSELGDVNVQVISFNATATASAMLDGASAKNYIDTLSATGGTNYQAALQTAQANPIDSYPDANTTQYYFISDGEPNTNISSQEYIDWQTYIKDSPIDKTYAIGVGGSVDATQLNYVSGEMSIGPDVVNETSGIDGDTIIINSITDLDSALSQTVNTAIITGNLTNFDVDGTALSLSADGGHISEISLYDQSGAITQTITYDSANPAQTFTTTLGGTLSLNFDDGSYSYTIDFKANIENKEEKIAITVVDNDGGTATNSVIIHINNTLDNNLAYDINGVDGGTGFDTLILSNAQSLDFDLISNIQNIEAIDMSTGDDKLLNLGLDDIIGMTDVDNELFVYGDAQDTISLDTTLINQSTTVTDTQGRVFDVYSDVNTTATLNIEQDIIVS